MNINCQISYHFSRSKNKFIKRKTGKSYPLNKKITPLDFRLKYSMGHSKKSIKSLQKQWILPFFVQIQFRDKKLNYWENGRRQTQYFKGFRGSQTNGLKIIFGIPGTMFNLMQECEIKADHKMV